MDIHILGYRRSIICVLSFEIGDAERPAVCGNDPSCRFSPILVCVTGELKHCVSALTSFAFFNSCQQTKYSFIIFYLYMYYITLLRLADLLITPLLHVACIRFILRQEYVASHSTPTRPYRLPGLQRALCPAYAHYTKRFSGTDSSKRRVWVYCKLDPSER